jgi:hypothetical protein
MPWRYRLTGPDELVPGRAPHRPPGPARPRPARYHHRISTSTTLFPAPERRPDYANESPAQDTRFRWVRGQQVGEAQQVEQGAQGGIGPAEPDLPTAPERDLPQPGQASTTSAADPDSSRTSQLTTAPGATRSSTRTWSHHAVVAVRSAGRPRTTTTSGLPSGGSHGFWLRELTLDETAITQESRRDDSSPRPRFQLAWSMKR